MKKMELTVLTPQGKHGPLTCDSVHVTVRDNKNGRGGGSYGIRAGSLSSLLALDDGELLAYCDGELLLKARCAGGFATVEHSHVTVVTEQYMEDNDGEI